VAFGSGGHWCSKRGPAREHAWAPYGARVLESIFSSPAPHDRQCQAPAAGAIGRLCVTAAVLAACASAAGAASDTRPMLVVQSGHVAPLQAAAFPPNGALLATGGADEVVKLWDVAMGREVRTLVGRPRVYPSG